MRPMSKAVAVCALALLAAGCGKSGGGKEISEPAVIPAVVAALPAPYNTGDVEHGRAVFAQCRSCHTVNAGGANMTGPNLHGLFGRKAGTDEGYKYSKVVSEAGFNWDAPRLDKWLTSPRDMLPGTKMAFVGLAEPKDRIDVIAYLRTETEPAAK